MLTIHNVPYVLKHINDVSQESSGRNSGTGTKCGLSERQAGSGAEAAAEQQRTLQQTDRADSGLAAGDRVAGGASV